MSKLFDQAVAAARRLSAEEQDALGAIILDEIADEVRWAKSFARSQERLAELADEALRTSR